MKVPITVVNQDGVIHIVLGIGGYVLLFIGWGSIFAGAMAGSGGIGELGLPLVIIGFLGVGANGVICLVETVLYLTKSDADFNRIYVAGNKAWF